MNFYPTEISQRFYAAKNAGKVENANAVGTGASFVCGAAARFFLRIEKDTKEILDARFKTNGCGFTIASADVLAEKILGKKLTGLHGSEKESLQAEIETELDKFPGNRKHCMKICIEALQAALADFRAFQIGEFAGEKALICTCFGVSEEAIEKIIAENEIEMVEEVTEISNAGGGCGSCQFLIQEMIDVYWRETR